jgi:exoribonuclease R
MTYEQAHNILHDKQPDDPLKPPPPPLTAGAPVDPSQIQSLKAGLVILQRLARKLRKDREEIGGAVDLSSGDFGTELKFVLDENGNPIKVTPKKEMEIHHTIAEMMILANQYVATKIYNSFPDSSLLRIHQAVVEDRFEELESALKATGISFDGSSNMALADSLKKAKQEGKGNKLVNSLLQSLATRYIFARL